MVKNKSNWTSFITTANIPEHTSVCAFVCASVRTFTRVCVCSSPFFLSPNVHRNLLFLFSDKGSTKTKTISFGSCFGLSQKNSFDLGDRTSDFEGYNSS